MYLSTNLLFGQSKNQSQIAKIDSEYTRQFSKFETVPELIELDRSYKKLLVVAKKLESRSSKLSDSLLSLSPKYINLKKDKKYFESQRDSLSSVIATLLISKSDSIISSSETKQVQNSEKKGWSIFEIILFVLGVLLILISFLAEEFFTFIVGVLLILLAIW
jgi:hypothetical protein